MSQLESADKQLTKFLFVKHHPEGSELEKLLQATAAGSSCTMSLAFVILVCPCPTVGGSVVLWSSWVFLVTLLALTITCFSAPAVPFHLQMLQSWHLSALAAVFYLWFS